MFTQFDHIKMFVQGYPVPGGYRWRVMSCSGRVLKDGFTSEKDAEQFAHSLIQF